MSGQLSFHLDGILHSKESYSDFDGPLDLILYLLSRNKVKIKDIQISLILDQYLDWMHHREQLDLEVASDFIVMAAHLIYLKTRQLISPDSSMDNELVQFIKSLEERSQMEEYKYMQLGVEYLGQRADIGREIYTTISKPLDVDNSYRYTHSPNELLRAWKDMQLSGKKYITPPVGLFQNIFYKEEYPIDMTLKQLTQRFLFSRSATISQLIYDCADKNEMISTFLAILELCKNGFFEIKDDDEDITLYHLSDKDYNLERGEAFHEL